MFGVTIIGLAAVLAWCTGQTPPATPTLPATASIGTGGATAEPGTPTPTPGPTPTPTEGEKAAAAVGQAYIAYRPTQAECDQAVESGDLESCVSPDSIQLITRPEWEKLFPDTDFYLIGLAGRNANELYDHSYRRRLAAWQDDQYYSAETFDRLLAANGIVVTDENRETVARAFALMTIYGYLEEEVDFTEWGEVEVEPGAFAYCLEAWTKIGGLELQWCFVFGDGRLSVAWGPDILQYYVGDYIDVPPDELPPLPPPTRYVFRGG